MLPDVITTLAQVKEALERAGVSYMVVGSLSSSLHGLPRATRDVDLVISLSREQVKPLINALQPRFYVSKDAAYQAIDHNSSFKAIHEETFFQVDLFVMESSPFNKAQFSRRTEIIFDPERNLSLPFQSAEDTVLSKLDWFRKGGRVSDRQWQDVIDILRTQGDRLDSKYLRVWAANLGIDDLLQRALEEHRSEPDRPRDEI